MAQQFSDCLAEIHQHGVCKLSPIGAPAKPGTAINEAASAVSKLIRGGHGRPVVPFIGAPRFVEKRADLFDTSIKKSVTPSAYDPITGEAEGTPLRKYSDTTDSDDIHAADLSDGEKDILKLRRAIRDVAAACDRFDSPAAAKAALLALLDN